MLRFGTAGKTGICLLMAAVVFGRETEPAGAFLGYGSAPRSQALGRAFAGIADDAQAGYYNPGGLFQLNSSEIIAAWSQLRDAQMVYVGSAIPTRGIGAFALSILNHTERMPADDGAGANENAFMVSYCYNPRHRFGLGATGKLVTRDVDSHSAIGFGLDVGMLVNNLGPFSFGLSARNLLPPTLDLDSTHVYARAVTAGLGIRMLDRVLIAADVVARPGAENGPDYEFAPHVGLEFHIIPKTLVQRIGFDSDEIGLGLGLQQHWGKASIGIDYAVLLSHRSDNGLGTATHKVGVSAGFAGFRAWINARPRVFRPTPHHRHNVLWMDIDHNSRAPARQWKVLIRNSYGKVVRTFTGWESPPARLSWDGLDDAGRLVFDGRYDYEVIIIDQRDSTLRSSGFLTRVRTRGPEGSFETIPGGRP